MKLEIIAIGDELLLGQTVNTNAAWLGQECTMAGMEVVHSSTISDSKEVIISALELGLTRSELIIITGGLGPTKDDITKYTLAEYFGTELKINQEVLERIEEFFRSFNRPMLEVNVQQAALPVDAEILLNDQGTASGMLFEKDGKMVVSLPGVPYEMKHLVRDRLIPLLRDRYDLTGNYYSTLKTQGIGESFLAERIEDIEDQISSKGFSFAYLPSPGQVRLRVGATDTPQNRIEVDQIIEEVASRIPEYHYGYDDESLSEVVGKLLTDQNASLGTVESCSAGSLASRIVSVPGSSAYFQGSFLSYSNELKQSLVGVNFHSLEKHGAVSEQVVKELALGGQAILGVDYCLSTSGIAGPTGGSDEKPVGTIWIGLAYPGGVYAKKFNFGNHRGRNIERTVLTALNLLRCKLMGINIEKST